MIDIVASKFITSAPDISAAPEHAEHNEVVFMARSNVGKSSLLNALTNHKGLAKVSGTPGKTRLINYFLTTFMNRDDQSKLEALFVDLPGFGYAKVSKSLLTDWEKNLTTFITERKQIKVFVHLMDARHPELPIDISVSNYLQEICREDQLLLQVFTKIDKLNQKEISALRRQYPTAMMISNTKKRGLDVLRQYIYLALAGERLHD